MVPVAVVGNDGAHGYPSAKGNQRNEWVIHVSGRRVIHDVGIVGWHINHLRIGWLNLDDRIGHDHQLLLDRFLDDRVGNRHDLLRRRLKRAGPLGLAAHVLDGVHHILVLGQECFAEVHRPG